jgi:hypothetical protein
MLIFNIELASNMQSTEGDNKDRATFSNAFEHFLEAFLGVVPENAVREAFTIRTLLALTNEEKEKAAEILVAELKKGNYNIRILMGIQELKPTDALVPLKKILKEKSIKHTPNVLIQIALALWLIEGYKESFELIAGVLKKPSAETVMLLQESQKMGDQNNCIEAMAALRFFRCQKTIKVLTECMLSDNKFIRGQAMRYALYTSNIITDLISYHPMQALAFAADIPSVRKLVIQQFDNLKVSASPLPVEPEFEM